MTDEIVITHANNGFIVESEDYIQVIENTQKKEYVIKELGKIFHDLLLNTMNAELANRVKVKIEIIKAD